MDFDLAFHPYYYANLELKPIHEHLAYHITILGNILDATRLLRSTTPAKDCCNEDFTITGGNEPKPDFKKSKCNIGLLQTRFYNSIKTPLSYIYAARVSFCQSCIKTYHAITDFYVGSFLFGTCLSRLMIRRHSKHSHMEHNTQERFNKQDNTAKK